MQLSGFTGFDWNWWVKLYHKIRNLGDAALTPRSNNQNSPKPSEHLQLLIRHSVKTI